MVQKNENVEKLGVIERIQTNKITKMVMRVAGLEKEEVRPPDTLR